MEKEKLVTALFSVLFILISFTSSGQTKLSWNDFQDNPKLTDSTSSYLDYDLSYKYQKQIINDTIIIYYLATSSIDKGASWVKEENKTNKELLINQLKVNTLEKYRINTQVFLDSVEHPLMIDSVFPLILDSLNAEMDLIQKESLSKTITELTNESTKSQQNSIGRSQNTIPAFESKKIGLGIHLGIGTTLISENINHFFTHPLVLTLGGELQTDKITYNLTSTVGWNKTKKAFTNEYEWSKNFGTTTLGFEANVGYNIDATQFKLIPFVGVSYFGIITLTGQKRSAFGNSIKEYNKYITVAPSVGIILDYKTKKTIKLLPSYANHSKKYNELNLRLKLSATPVDFNNGITGTLYNTTIGISSFSKPIKLK